MGPHVLAAEDAPAPGGAEAATRCRPIPPLAGIASGRIGEDCQGSVLISWSRIAVFSTRRPYPDGRSADVPVRASFSRAAIRQRRRASPGARRVAGPRGGRGTGRAAGRPAAQTPR